MTDLFVQLFGSFVGGVDHLAEHWLLFFKVCQLVLEVVVLLFLVHHPHLQLSVEGLYQGHRSVTYLIVFVSYLRLEWLQILPEKFDEFVVLLQVFVCFSGEILH